MEVVQGKVAQIFESAQLVIVPRRDPIVLMVGISAIAGAVVDEPVTLTRETPRSPWVCEGRAVAQTAEEAGWRPKHESPIPGTEQIGEGERHDGDASSETILPPERPNPLEPFTPLEIQT